MVKVKFYGDLKQFGDGSIELDVSNFKELMSGLLTQIKGLRQHLRKGYYKVRIGNQYLSEDQLKMNPLIDLKSGCTVHLTPVLAGAGKAASALQIVAGIVIIAVSWWNPFNWTAGTALMFGAMGASMALSGAMTLLTKMPTMDTKNNEGEKKQSTSFSNIKNLTPQGRPIPLLYGKMLTSLVLISQGVETFDDMPQQENTQNNRGRNPLSRALGMRG